MITRKVMIREDIIRARKNGEWAFWLSVNVASLGILQHFAAVNMRFALIWS